MVELPIIPTSSEVGTTEEECIPKDLYDSIDALDDMFSTDELTLVTECDDEEDFMASCHHSTGRQLRNKWKLWYPEESELARWFNSIGIHHADDMSGIILTSFYRAYLGKPIKLDKQVEYCKKYWGTNEDD